MNILIIHNDNIPDHLVSNLSKTDGFNVDCKIFRMQPTDQTPFDTFICSKLSEWLTDDEIKYDTLILPYSVTEKQIEYTGLRIAAHIRLTKEWHDKKKNKYLNIPIIFMGPDSKEDVMTFSNIGNILLSFNIYTTCRTNTNEVVRILNWIEKQNHKHQCPDTYDEILKTTKYKDLLNRLSTIKPPANYATHHSIANEWAIMRWIEMIAWEEGKKPTLDNKDFTSMLYFKYLSAKFRSNEKSADNTEKVDIMIEGIDKKRIVYIDDEVDKGWGEKILVPLFKHNGAKPLCFKGFDKKLSREALIERIKDYISKNEADCYIIDLRLHDDDFNNPEKLSGHQILDFMKEEINPATPVILFTASNKVWNYRMGNEVKNNDRYITNTFNDYIVKESPEQELDNEQSKQFILSLFNAVQNACGQSKLKDIYKDIKGWQDEYKKKYEFSLLHEFLRLLILDNNTNKPEIIKASALTLSVFIEKTLTDKYELTKDLQIILIANPKFKWNCKNKYYLKKDKSDDNKIIELLQNKITENYQFKCDSIYYNKNDYTYPLILLTLKEVYSISFENINKWIHFKNARNTIAHKGDTLEGIKNLKKELINIFNEIVKPIMKKQLY